MIITFFQFTCCSQTDIMTAMLFLKEPEMIDYKLALLVYKCWHRATPSFWWTPWAGRFRGMTSTMFCLVVASHPPHAVTKCRWPSFPSCCSSCPEQCVTALHVCTAQWLPVFCNRLDTHLFRHCLCCYAWELTSSYLNTLITFVIYLLTLDIIVALSPSPGHMKTG